MMLVMTHTMFPGEYLPPLFPSFFVRCVCVDVHFTTTLIEGMWSEKYTCNRMCV